MKVIFKLSICLLLVLRSTPVLSQIPAGAFTINPTPICAANTYTITDLSTNSPTAWSYTIQAGGFGPPATPTIVTVQNPTVSFNNQGTYTITQIASNGSGSGVAVTHTLSVLAAPNANINPANQNSCIGGSIASISITSFGGGFGGALSYSWSTGSTASLISVSPSLTTTYSCVISGTNGCSATRVATINIGSPLVSITSFPSSICPGTSSTLTAIGSGGGPYTYVWSSASNTNVITSSLPGIYTATVTNSLGCSGIGTYSLSTSTTLSLNISSTPSVFCSANAGSLHITGASSYTWNTGSTSPNPTVHPSSSTTYSVIGNIGTCFGTAVINLSVSISPTLSVVGTSTAFCNNASATLTASGANAYTWTPGNIYTASVAVSPVNSTTYTIRGLNPGCPAKTTTLAIKILAAPVLQVAANSTTGCLGDNFAIVASGASSYSWNNGATGAIILVTPTISSIYWVSATGTNNCVGQTSITLNVSQCVGIIQTANLETSLKIFPNPAKDILNLLSSQEESIEFIDITGHLVKTLSLNSNKEIQVNVNEFQKGLYFIRQTKSGHVQKIIIE